MALAVKRDLNGEITTTTTTTTTTQFIASNISNAGNETSKASLLSNMTPYFIGFGIMFVLMAVLGCVSYRRRRKMERKKYYNLSSSFSLLPLSPSASIYPSYDNIYHPASPLYPSVSLNKNIESLYLDFEPKPLVRTGTGRSARNRTQKLQREISFPTMHSVRQSSVKGNNSFF